LKITLKIEILKQKPNFEKKLQDHGNENENFNTGSSNKNNKGLSYVSF